MASTYFEGAPEIQPANNLQTLYLMSPPQQSSFIFLSQQHLVGIPLHHQPQNSIDFQSQQGWPSAPAPVSAQQGLSQKLSTTTTNTGDGAMTVTGRNGVLGSDKYLKAAQQLLDEVVNMNNEQVCRVGITTMREKGRKDKSEAGGKMGGDGSGGDLSVAERHEVQMKKAKLVNMLDEVEQRYRQYHHQMQMVVSSFEAVAGYGSAKSYTALALQTISKQFRCLRDTISDQVRATSKSLGGEEDCLPLAGAGGSKSSVGSRLRFVDHHIRQQRALQQLGMMQHNAWRPQRGLPERAVSVLRAWLFEHFLHPYPKDSDKHMLAKQTGLTRSQVSNWFINARVRLWKPMVEEMYLEETKEREQSNDDNNTTTKISKSETSDHSLSPSKSPSHQPTTSSPSVADHHPKHSSPLSSALHSSSDFNMMFTDESLIQQRMKKPRTTTTTTNENQMPDELSNRELLMKFMDQGGAFGGYPMSEIARFDHHEQFPPPRFGANGVSLTLGLPHCEYLSTESIQMGRSIEMNTAENNNYFNLNNTNGNNLNNPSSSHTPSGYESINIQNRKRFSAQLLPDYVA